MKNRAKTLGLHSWTKQDLILTFYWVKYGLTGMYLRDEQGLADFIGVSKGSLVMQGANFRFLLGKTDGVLTDYSELQRLVYEEYNGMKWGELRVLVREIIDQDGYDRKMIFNRSGKDYSKMVKV
jgi:hypothetical protein